jgi:hypothetical protein
MQTKICTAIYEFLCEVKLEILINCSLCSTLVHDINYISDAVFWDVTRCGSCKARHFGGTYHLLHIPEDGILIVTAVKTSNLTIFVLC